jgi:hypothetical protein
MTEPEPLIHSTDKALLDAATTGQGALPVGPELMQQMADAINTRTAYIAAEYPALVAACPDETKLAVTAWVFGKIVDHAEQGGTFRYLIYDRLGFGPEAYVPLYLAGGMTISNEFDLTEFGSTRRAERLTAALARYAEHHGGIHETPDCPADDTCTCKFVAEVNDLLKGHDNAR